MSAEAGVTLDGLFNYRDLGGLPLRAGGHTASGVFSRSDALHALTDAGVAALAASGITTVVDFRAPAERASAPDRLPVDGSIHEVELPLLDGDMSRAAGAAASSAAGAAATGDAGSHDAAVAQALAFLPTLPGLYTGMLEGAGSSFVRVAQLIAGGDGGVLIHCTAGKDRTGVCAAVILDAVGVERDAIIGDYALTQANLAGPWLQGMQSAIAQLGVPITPEMTELMGGSPPEAIEAALAWLDARGGAATYLLEIGLSEDDLAALRIRVTEGGLA